MNYFKHTLKMLQEKRIYIVMVIGLFVGLFLHYAIDIKFNTVFVFIVIFLTVTIQEYIKYKKEQA